MGLGPPPTDGLLQLEFSEISPRRLRVVGHHAPQIAACLVSVLFNLAAKLDIVGRLYDPGVVLFILEREPPFGLC